MRRRLGLDHGVDVTASDMHGTGSQMRMIVNLFKTMWKKPISRLRRTIKDCKRNPHADLNPELAGQWQTVAAKPEDKNWREFLQNYS